MVTLGVLMTIFMVVCFLVNLGFVLINILRGNVLWSMWFALGLYMSYTMIGNFATATVEFINRGL